MYVRVGAGLGALASPWITTGIDVPVRHFECLPGPRRGLDDFVPTPLSVAERIAMLKEDAGGAAFLASRAASALATLDADAIAAFRKAFGLSPTALPKGLRESFGSIIRRRFEGTFRLLESGGLLYSCGLPARAGGPETGHLSYTTKVTPGQYWIALGAGFWTELVSDDRFAMLLMAALRVGYGKWVREGPSGVTTASAPCYAKFAFLAAEAEPPPFIEEACPDIV